MLQIPEPTGPASLAFAAARSLDPATRTFAVLLEALREACLDSDPHAWARATRRAAAGVSHSLDPAVRVLAASVDAWQRRDARLTPRCGPTAMRTFMHALYRELCLELGPVVADRRLVEALRRAERSEVALRFPPAKLL